MTLVDMRFVGGPADGEIHQLPVDPDGVPPARWVLSHRGEGDRLPEIDHLYQRQPVGNGGWEMSFVRSDPMGMTE
ncbi:hypothetical protein [Micromonospora sp. NPDC004704]